MNVVSTVIELFTTKLHDIIFDHQLTIKKIDFGALKRGYFVGK
jgi:hypothetical protein